MNYKLIFPSKYLRNIDLQGKDFTLKIKRLKMEDLETERGTESKGLLYFDGAKKAMVLSRTVAEACVLMFGEETNDWIGKRLTIYGIDTDEPFAVTLNVRGSPDIDRPMSAVIPRGKKKIKLNLVPTGKAKSEGADQLASPMDEPSDAEPAAEPSDALEPGAGRGDR